MLSVCSSVGSNHFFYYINQICYHFFSLQTNILSLSLLYYMPSIFLSFNLRQFVTVQIHRQQIMFVLTRYVQLSVSRFQNTSASERLHTLIENGSFSSPTNVESHNPLPLGQRLHWHTPRCLALKPFITAEVHCQQILSALIHYVSLSASQF